MMLALRPNHERTLQATIRMERLTTILSYATAIPPYTAREITQIIREPMYDCNQVACDPVLKRRNHVARLKLQALLRPVRRATPAGQNVLRFILDPRPPNATGARERPAP
jgi:hypothetical protein